MTVIELDAKKVEFARQILDENNADVLEKAITYFKKAKKVAFRTKAALKEGELAPFFTPEDLEDIERARQQIRDGNCIVCRTKEESRRFLESL
ncbi:hypothetical protein Barb7_01975 [Bacteroidales bacterium Barb7]|nr:hypothetical protein Barb7_01975 [Bacteroidales bacterium Barb7]